MDRAARIASFWNWLPAFRASAEYGSIQRAALALHLSPSALSRTIRLLEDTVGTPLFVRGTGGLTLTRAGTELAKATRDAMRTMDDALERMDDDGRLQSTWTAGACGPLLGRLLAEGVATLLRGHDSADARRVRVAASNDEKIAEELMRGDVDLVIVDSASVGDVANDLKVDEIGELRFGLYTAGTSKDAPAPSRVVTLAGTSASEHDVAATAATLDGVEILAEQCGMLAHLPTALAPARFRLVQASDTVQRVVGISRQRLEGQEALWTDGLLAALRRHLTPPE